MELQQENVNEELQLVSEIAEKCKLSSNGKIKDNNNEQDYANHEPNEPESGRISGASGESAFSSSIDFCSETGSDISQSLSDINLNEVSSGSTSGRSSANKDNASFEHDKLLNPISNLVPEVKEARELVDRVRVRVLDNLSAQHKELETQYEPTDVEQLTKPLPAVDKLEQSVAFRLISRFLNFQTLLQEEESTPSGAKKVEKELNIAVEAVHELLKFRHQYQLAHTRADSFAKELHLLSGCFPFGHDKNHTPVLYLRAYVHRKWSPRFDEVFRRYVAWQINQITKSHFNAKVNKTVGYTGIEKDGSFGICFDCVNVSYSCLDMEFLRFLVRLLVQYYPTYCRYSLCVDLPWLFRSVWKLVRSWLPADAQNTVQLITSKQLTDFIDRDQIPNSMRVNDLETCKKLVKNKNQLPEDWNNFKGIEEVAIHLNLGSNEIKQFKVHVEKIRKEYEQMGAL